MATYWEMEESPQRERSEVSENWYKAGRDAADNLMKNFPSQEAPSSFAAPAGSAVPHSTVPLPDGIVIGGPWPHTIVSWPGGKSRGATKLEYDLFQALEAAHAEIERLHGIIRPE